MPPPSVAVLWEITALFSSVSAAVSASATPPPNFALFAVAAEPPTVAPSRVIAAEPPP